MRCVPPVLEPPASAVPFQQVRPSTDQRSPSLNVQQARPSENTSQMGMPGSALTRKQTITYRVCSGEYERACQPHDIYLYCYSDVAQWAKQRCSSYNLSRVSSYSGNKCGYEMSLLTCEAPLQ
jgi:hypothetical protein